MKRQSKSLGSSLERRLNSYALAASAAGVGMLALAKPADAKIVYTPAHKHVALNSKYVLDLNHDGIGDFRFSNQTGGRDSFRTDALEITPEGQNAVQDYASVLHRGAQIGPKEKFQAGTQLMLKIRASCFGTTQGGTSCVTSGIGGHWWDITRGYLGLKFFIHGKAHYGWARLNVKITYGIDTLLTGYAYETIPNKPIIAGKTHGADVITVEQGTLGHLARGASAIPAWRAKERK